jgi:response regulator of citrate/malate metabolism
MRNRQKHMATEEIDYGLRMARVYVTLTRALHDTLLTETAARFGSESETLLVLLAIFIGDAENRPMSASKIAGYVGLPRASVYRRIAYLTKAGRIERCRKRTYRLVPGTMRGDPHQRLRKIIRKFNIG